MQASGITEFRDFRDKSVGESSDTRRRSPFFRPPNVSLAKRRGFSLPELLIVIVITSILMFRIAPVFSELKARSALRATRQELTSVFSVARAAALQKGRVATLSLTNGVATVTTVSQYTGATVTLAGPIRFNNNYGTVLTPLGSAPTTVSFDGRGLVTPATTNISKYRLSNSQWADTVCISGSGMIMLRGCQL
jgi:prepilin-type N-terminal cleavage/methylation domain-containing protein